MQIRALLSSGFKRLSRFLRLGIVEASFTLLSLLKTLQIRNDGFTEGMQLSDKVREYEFGKDDDGEEYLRVGHFTEDDTYYELGGGSPKYRKK